MNRRNLAGSALLVFSMYLGGQPSGLPRFDLLLRGGTIVDGTGGAPFRGDVGVIGKHIARVGDLSGALAATVVDASGLYVAPGFINIHSHASPGALSTADNMLLQGVTLEILNADGSGPADIGQQLSTLAANGLAVNVGANTGFNSAWSSVVGDADRRPTPEELQKMRDILAGNLEQGAWGVSAGLDYKPAYFSTTQEVIEVVRAAAPFRTNFTNHDRITPESSYSSKVGMTETMAIGARAGLVPVITHMKLQGREQGTAAAFLKTMSEATSRGRYTAADAYPYLAGQTGLGVLIIPGWAQDGGRARMLERFKDPELREKIVAEAEEAMAARFGGAAGVYLPELKRELVDVMQERGVRGGEAVVRLLEEGNYGIIARFGLEADLVRILQHPTTSIACDCGAAQPGRASHPRFYGTYPRVLGRYVRETKALTWQDAVRKMTLLPAATIGIVDRGALAAGMVADITVFDPATVIDHATFDDPTAASDGIRHVLVNGGFAVRDGKVTGDRRGEALYRSRHMPSRPMNGPDARHLGVKSQMTFDGPPTAAIPTLVIDLTQPERARAARGTFRYDDPQNDMAIESVELGILQTAGEWASVSSRVRDMKSGGERSAVVILDGRDPRGGNSATMEIWIEGRPPIRGRLTRPERVRIR